MNNLPQFEVGQFVEIFNQSIETAFSLVQIVGEVASFKLNQGKYVFFDLKDEQATVSCFMMKFKLNLEIEDGMKVMVLARPKLTAWGKFSLTVEQIKPFGKGSLQKARQLLIAKLTKEGLFAPEYKQSLPDLPQKIAVIGAVDSAGFADFKRIIGDNWPVLKIVVKNTTVQGDAAAEQIVAAIEQINDTANDVEMITILRGGGSKDDLSCFDDERIARAIFGSKLPIATGIGHEIDLSIADLVADKYFATPTHLAKSIVPDKTQYLEKINDLVADLPIQIGDLIEQYQQNLTDQLEQVKMLFDDNIERKLERIVAKSKLLEAYNPQLVLERGYSIVRGRLALKEAIEIETRNKIIKAKVEAINDKQND